MSLWAAPLGSARRVRPPVSLPALAAAIAAGAALGFWSRIEALWWAVLAGVGAAGFAGVRWVVPWLLRRAGRGISRQPAGLGGLGGSAWVPGAPGVTGGGWIAAPWPARPGVRRAAAAALCALMLGAGGLRASLWLREAEQWRSRIAGLGPVDLVGVVDGEPGLFPFGAAITLRVETAAGPDGRPVGGPQGLTPRVRVTIPFDLYVPIPVEGQRVGLRAAFEIPPPASQPGGFSLHDYLQRQGVLAVATLRHRERLWLAGDPQGISPLRRLVRGLRARVESGIAQALDPRDAGLVKGLLLGDKQAIDPRDRQSFRSVGLAHALAVSGLHVGILAGMVLVVAQRARVPVPLPQLLAATAGWVYVLASGLPASGQRAAWMATVALAGSATHRRAGPVTALAGAAAWMLWSHPALATDPGFQLSFAATAAILALAGPLAAGLGEVLPAVPRGLATAAAVTAAAQLGTAPLVALYFGQFTPWAVLINLPVGPLLSVVLLGGFALAAVPAGWEWVLGPLGDLVRLALAALRALIAAGQRLPFHQVSVAAPRPPELAAWAAGLVALRAGLAGLLGGGITPRLATRLGWALGAVAVVAALRAVAGLGPALSGSLSVLVLDPDAGGFALVSSPEGRHLLTGAAAGGQTSGEPPSGGAASDEQLSMTGLSQPLVGLLRRRGIGGIDLAVLPGVGAAQQAWVEDLQREIPVRARWESGQGLGGPAGPAPPPLRLGRWTWLWTWGDEGRSGGVGLLHGANALVLGSWRGLRHAGSPSTIGLQAGVPVVAVWTPDEAREAGAYLRDDGSLTVPEPPGGWNAPTVSLRAVILRWPPNSRKALPPDLESRLERAGVPLFRTDRHGAVEVRLGPGAGDLRIVPTRRPR